MSLLVNPDSANNNIQNEVKYALHLEGHGYLCNNSNWVERLENEGMLESFDFLHDGDACRFDEAPVDLFERIHFINRSSLSIHRLSIHTSVEEMVFV
jgi:hypothetical protein